MIYIVIVNWRGYSDTIECLESLMRLKGPDFRILVIDNESDSDAINCFTDWAAGVLSPALDGGAWQKLPKVRLRQPTVGKITSGVPFDATVAPLVTVIAMVENAGFAGGNNVGIKAALSDPACDYIWLLNNDTVVDPDALTHLLARMERGSRAGICGSTLVYYDAPEIVQSIGGVFNRFRGAGHNLFMHSNIGDLPSEDVIEPILNYVVGASMFLPRSFVTAIGFMEEQYFLYFEELDWCSRCNNQFPVMWASKSIVYHKEGRSIGTNSRGKSSNTSIYYHNVNYLRVVRKFWPATLPVALVKVCVASVKRLLFGDFEGAQFIGMALYDYVTGRRRTGAVGSVTKGA